jgi:tryptophanyl-tRNA synthetase
MIRLARPRQCRTYSSQQSQTIFSGIQPTGIPHLGNYLGALRNWTNIQSSRPNATIYYSIVDLHAITSPYDPTILRQNRDQMWYILHAIGIDMQRSTVFEQSAVSPHLI